ncbi:MAG: hypothetical protein E7504_05400, partial [Ruminococcus sp.]|nr:hypothetical protein [Ruminococcus sp.]
MKKFYERIIGHARFLGKQTTYYAELTADTAADMPDPADHPEWEVGSELLVLEDGGSRYRLSNSREWVKVNFNTGQGGGEKGDDGYTPIRGVDYWTEADVEAINTATEAFVVSELADRAQ